MNKKKKFEDFFLIFDNFNYYESNNDTKKHYLLASLFEASNTAKMVDFYARCYNFSLKEIESLLQGYINSEFDIFLEDIILNFKESMNICLFKSSIIKLINDIIGIKEDEYYIDNSYMFRGSIVKRRNDYIIYKEILKNNEWAYLSKEKGFKTYDEAYLKLTKTINYLNNDIKNHIEEENINQNVDIDVFNNLAHSYKTFLESSNLVEKAIFLLYYFLTYQNVRSYCSYLHNKKKDDLDLLISTYPEFKNEFKSLKKNKDKVYTFVCEEIKKYTQNDKFNISLEK